MTIYQVVSVRDDAVQAFNRPFYTVSVGQAHRSFSDEVNRKADDNPMFKHASDFSLWHLGSFDDETGRFVQFDLAIRLCNAGDVLVD